MPQPPPPPAPAPATDPPPGPSVASQADATPPLATLSARRTQRVAPFVVVAVSCHDEPCVARISATIQIARRGATKARNIKLASVRQPVAMGAKAKVRLRLAATPRRAIRRALIQGRRVTMRVQAVIADGEGNKVNLTYTVRLAR
ncbi:MAG TPA: hypothetical protein VFZ89_10230 [Solirubrobacteraceae bacterium]